MKVTAPELHEMGLDECIKALSELKAKHPDVAWKVRIPYTNRRPSCVGAIVGLPTDKENIVYLFPCPEDIDRITALRKLVVNMSCDKAMNGQRCETCTSILQCEVMKRFEDNMKIFHNDA